MTLPHRFTQMKLLGEDTSHKQPFFMMLNIRLPVHAISRQER